MARSTVASQLAAIKKQQEALAKKEAALLQKNHSKVLTKIVQLAKDSGLTAKDIAAALSAGKKSKASTKKSGAKPSKLAGKKVAPKYRNPANHAETWTGRGIAPGWIAALKSEGKLDTALIQH